MLRVHIDIAVFIASAAFSTHWTLYLIGMVVGF